jgi:hypothetical protein
MSVRLSTGSPRACSGLNNGPGASHSISRRCAREIGRGTIAADDLCETEVENLHRSVRRDLDVRGLQVAVDDPLFMRDFEGLGDLPRDIQHLSERKSAALLMQIRRVRERVCERGALDELENQEANVVGFLEAVDRADVGMVERREHSRFAFEARQSIGMPGERRWQNLDGDIAPELRIVRTVDFAHAARAEQRVQAIPAKQLPGHVRQRVRSIGGELERRCREKSVVRRLVQQ